ncbi:hypothetical protein SAY86_021563 [Trapa natans]|uniref:Uncharacterized protein n=1 Tax=Trapa natans TaxID=22666 RepID=A0AAN7RK99_TRANT|nr:hypothetical protein SAY86_021563 [Trapa natans]
MVSRLEYPRLSRSEIVAFLKVYQIIPSLTEYQLAQPDSDIVSHPRVSPRPPTPDFLEKYPARSEPACILQPFVIVTSKGHHNGIKQSLWGLHLWGPAEPQSHELDEERYVNWV